MSEIPFYFDTPQYVAQTFANATERDLAMPSPAEGTLVYFPYPTKTAIYADAVARDADLLAPASGTVVWMEDTEAYLVWDSGSVSWVDSEIGHYFVYDGGEWIETLVETPLPIAMESLDVDTLPPDDPNLYDPDVDDYLPEEELDPRLAEDDDPIQADSLTEVMTEVNVDGADDAALIGFTPTDEPVNQVVAVDPDMEDTP
jgi:hypothetical protein